MAEDKEHKGPLGRELEIRCSDQAVLTMCPQKTPSDSLSCLYPSKFPALECFLVSAGGRLLPMLPHNTSAANIPLGTCISKGQGRRAAVIFARASLPL